MRGQRYQRWWDGLSEAVQEDFSGGAYPGYSRDSVPASAVEDAVNVLITDDGQLARRGGSVYKSNADLHSLLNPFPTVGGRLLWDGYLAGGHRTVLMGQNNLSILGLDDATPTTLLAGFDTELGHIPAPTKPAVVNGMLVIPFGNTVADGGSFGAIYGGSRKTAAYTTGTVDVTPGSATVVGHGTSWLANVDKGMLFAPGGTVRTVDSVTDDTHLVLSEPYPATAGALTGSAYSLAPIGNTGPPINPPAGVYPLFGSVANKLLALLGSRLYMSEINRPDFWPLNEYHQFPTGTQLLGVEELRGQAIVFTTTGIWTVANIAYSLTDAAGNPIQRLEQVSRNLILWSWAGVVNHDNTLIVPALDGIWRFDGISAPQRISGGIGALYRSYVKAGYHAGIAAVNDGYYHLPILNGANAVVDTLVCRLQATVRGGAFGWSRFSGAGANIAAFAVRTGTPQSLLLGADATTGRILTLSYRDGTVTTDADGSTHVATIVTRELTGDISTLAKKLRIRYELTDPSTVNPTLTAEWAQAGSGYTTVSPAASETTAPSPNTWLVDKRNPHFRLKTVGATSNFTLHSITVFFRTTGRP